MFVKRKLLGYLPRSSPAGFFRLIAIARSERHDERPPRRMSELSNLSASASGRAMTWPHNLLANSDGLNRATEIIRVAVQLRRLGSFVSGAVRLTEVHIRGSEVGVREHVPWKYIKETLHGSIFLLPVPCDPPIIRGLDVQPGSLGQSVAKLICARVRSRRQFNVSKEKVGRADALMR